MTEALLAAIGALFSALLGSFAIYRKAMAKKDKELATANAALHRSGELHRATIERLEGAKDKVENELRGLYERMLDAACATKRGDGKARPHRGAVETLEERRERLLTVTGTFSDADRREYARRLATGPIVAEPDPPTL